MKSCALCGKCCTYIGTKIDTPEDKEDFENIIWYLLHENVHVYIDNDDDWILEFRTRCKALDKDNMCRIHERKPGICIEHDPSSCERNSECDNGEKHSFHSVRDFKRYCLKHLKVPLGVDFLE